MAKAPGLFWTTNPYHHLPHATFPIGHRNKQLHIEASEATHIGHPTILEVRGLTRLKSRGRQNHTPPRSESVPLPVPASSTPEFLGSCPLFHLQNQLSDIFRPLRDSEYSASLSGTVLVQCPTRIIQGHSHLRNTNLSTSARGLCRAGYLSQDLGLGQDNFGVIILFSTGAFPRDPRRECWG